MNDFQVGSEYELTREFDLLFPGSILVFKTLNYSYIFEIKEIGAGSHRGYHVGTNFYIPEHELHLVLPLNITSNIPEPLDADLI